MSSRAIRLIDLQPESLRGRWSVSTMIERKTFFQTLQILQADWYTAFLHSIPLTVETTAACCCYCSEFLQER